MEPDIPDLTAECLFSTSRSSGPGGQHVNKTETKVELRFNPETSLLLTNEQKTILRKHLSGKLASDNTIVITCQETRSQIKNKVIAVKKLHEMLSILLTPQIPRIATKPTKESKEKRIASKKQQGELKTLRGNLKDKTWNEEG